MVNEHAQEIKVVLAALHVSADQGLSTEEADERVHQYGFNEIHKESTLSPFTIFLRQFASPLIWILLITTIISAFLREYADALVIFALVLINSILGFFQEYRTERAIEALQKLAAFHSTVIRDSRVTRIDSRSLVPGDILIVETGDKIAADARVIEATNFATHEAALTGESTPVPKNPGRLPEKTPLADQKNMLFSGTLVTRGRATAVITATGMATQFGHIAQLIQEPCDETTPLQHKMAQFAQWITLAAILIVLITFGAGVLRGQPLLTTFITAISLAVAAVPEGLPIIVTISLALGVKRMAKRNALMRKLSSAETLGSVSVICTDKTGTLTHNEMTVRKIFVDNTIVDVTGSGYSAQGLFSVDTHIIDPHQSASLVRLLTIGMLCTNATITEENNVRTVVGDPTEGCLIVSAEKAGLSAEQLHMKYPRFHEIEFTSERKRMTTIHTMNKTHVAFSKGAPDVLLERCNRILINNRIERLTRTSRQNVLAANEQFAHQALRVLGFATKDTLTTTNPDDIEKDMIFVGLQAMIDPPRDGVKEALRTCTTAGIKVVMVTGDHKTTAVAIAKEIGITGDALTGEELDALSQEELAARIEHIGIVARVNPEHKMTIIDAFKARNHVVAMTGDGVNDAPALKKADIGIAMGITGTDVSKEASDMILTDDHFTSIVNAVEEGRTIFDNIRKFIVYLLSSNTGELLTIFISMLLGLPLPLIAVQILLMNLLTDGIPATALSFEPPDEDVMRRPPRSAATKIIGKKRLLWMLAVGSIMMLGTLGIFAYSLFTGGWQPGQLLGEENALYRYATTLAFTTIILFQMFHALNAKNLDRSLFVHGHLISNTWLLVGIASSIALQVAIVHLPLLNAAFGTVPLSIADWLGATLVASSVVWGAELIKLVGRFTHITLDEQ